MSKHAGARRAMGREEEYGDESAGQTMEAVLDRKNLKKAYRAVRRKAGSGGIDGRTIEQTTRHLREHGEKIEAKLRLGTYVPSPVRGVEIAKADGGKRRLGIPTVQDRFIQQALGQVLSARVDAGFSVHSYGYRPGRCAQDAVRAAQGYVREGKSWVVALDISAFFDEVDHGILMRQVRGHEQDERVLSLIRRYLRAGIVVGGRQERRRRGTPQGGPLSPLLANLYLDPLDKELERRGLSFCRYADDVAIYVGSKRSGERVLASISKWVEKHLKLRVNRTKSGTGRPWERQFLGFTIDEQGRIAVAESRIARFKEAVRRHWDARQSLSSRELIGHWQRYVRGWSNYFALADERERVHRLEGWVRRHMRKCFWLRWHGRAGRLAALKRLGARPYHWTIASSRRGAWRVARGPALQTALNNRVLQRWGLWVPSQLWAA